MTSRDHDGPTNDDELLPRLFRALGPAPALPIEMRRAWESTFHNELMRHLSARRQRRNRLVSGCVSIVALVALATYVLREPPLAPDIAAAEVARVALVIGRAESFGARATRALGVGDELGAGQTLRTGPGTLLALRYRDADVRLNSNTVVAFLPTRLQLARGDVYVDSGAARHRGPTVMIETPRGMLAHVGTQFEVSVDDDEVRAAVREGAVAFTSDGDHRTINAADGPTQIVVSATGVTTQRVAGTGALWDWVVAAAPGYVVNGRSADEFLVWATRQMGTQLRYADDAARFHSQTVIMHGNVRPLSVAQGLEVLNATTGLDLDESDPDVLRVSVRRSNP
jgi:ferric-dicitrate binding protein FerR (iron transport regulator)